MCHSRARCKLPPASPMKATNGRGVQSILNSFAAKRDPSQILDLRLGYVTRSLSCELTQPAVIRQYCYGRSTVGPKPEVCTCMARKGSLCGAKRINLDFVQRARVHMRSQGEGERGEGIPFSALKIATRPTPTEPSSPVPLSLLILPVSPDSNA